MKTNVVLIDGENVQLKNASPLNGDSFKIKVFLGAQQTKIPLETARALQVFGERAQYIQIDGNGKNALDFHIAYYLGRLAAEAPDDRFHVISSDTGFDPLIKHLKSQGIVCLRSKSIVDISLHSRVDAVIDNLIGRRDTKPRTLKTLRRTIKALLGNLEDEALDEVIKQLALRGTIKVADGKVDYEPAS